MVTIRLGGTWREDPALRAALGRGPAAARAAAESAVDALALEVDGVDVAAGRAEGALVPCAEALGEAVLRLLGGAARAAVHFGEGGVELVLARRGASALLTVVSLGRPARVLARDVEVELADLASAARAAALELADTLASLAAGGAALAVPLRALGERLAAARPREAGAAPEPRGGGRPRPRRRRGGPACAFELADGDGVLASYSGGGADLGSLLAPGKVTLRAADGRELVALDGPPFLALRYLDAFAGRLADAARRGDRAAAVTLARPGRSATVELACDLAAGTARRDAAPPLPCPALPLARAVLEAALDLCGVVAARNPWQAENAWLGELRSAAAERLLHVEELLAGDLVAAAGERVRARRAPRLPGAPLGPGRTRRLLFRRAWGANAGGPAGFGLALSGDAVVAAGAAAVLGIDARTGEVRWRRGGAALAVLREGSLYAADGVRLAHADPSSGRERWSRSVRTLPEGGVRDVVRLGGGLALVVAPGAACALDPAHGRTVWTFAPPAALDLRAAAAGAFALVGSDAGFLYGLEAATGRPAWRLRLPGTLVAPPLAFGEAALALCATDLGGSLLALDPATGRRRFEVPLDVTPHGSPVPFAGLLAVAGTVAGDPVVTAVDPVAGRLAWEDAPTLPQGALALTALPGGLLAATPSGACAALDRAGEVRWSRGRDLPHGPAAAAPLFARGVALVPGEGVDALDAATGALLGHARAAPPVRLAASADLHLWCMDADGVVTALRLATHLGVV